jgi:hypothetical protein
MRYFHDTESIRIVSETELLQEFIQLSQESPNEYENMTFGQYLNNCLTINNGTLQEI